MLYTLFLAVSSVIQLTPPTAFDYKQIQLAAHGNTVAATFAWQNKVMFASSSDGGVTWTQPRLAAEPGILSAGRHRGPRIALSGDSIVISVVAGEHGGGKDGDLVAFRSTDAGATWHREARINDVPGAAREGLHAMAAGPDGLLYAAWLDLRKAGTRLYGSASTDSGKTWSPNKEIYASPSGTICQCCHPSLAIDGHGTIAVMWRNAMDGNRDFYTAASRDAGKSFSDPEKLGAQSWKLDACPMDGGGVAFDNTAKPLTAWRREQAIFLARPGEVERKIGEGKDPAIAIGSAGTYVAWRAEGGIALRSPGHEQPAILDPVGQYPQLIALPTGDVLAAWESKGQIRFQHLR